MTEFNGFVYSLHLRGIWGRKRKADFECFSIGDDKTLPDAASIAAKAVAMTAELKAKAGATWSVVAYPCQHRDNESPLIGITQGKTIDKGAI